MTLEELRKAERAATARTLAGALGELEVTWQSDVHALRAEVATLRKELKESRRCHERDVARGYNHTLTRRRRQDAAAIVAWK